LTHPVVDSRENQQDQKCLCNGFTLHVTEDTLRKGALAVLALLAFCGVTGPLKDAKSVVEDVAQSVGAANLKSIHYSGRGYA
jgi:hypothetical protein